MVRADLRIPEHRGAAIGAEMKFDFSPRDAGADVDLARPLDAHLLLWEMGAGAEGRAGTPLALCAMTNGHDPRLAGHTRSDPQQQRAILVILGNLPFLALSPPYIRNGAELRDRPASSLGLP